MSSNVCSPAGGTLSTGASVTVHSTQPIYVGYPNGSTGIGGIGGTPVGVGTGIIGGGLHVGGWDPSTYGWDTYRVHNQDYTPDWVFQQIDSDTILKYVEEKNYHVISMIGDHVLKRDRKLFSKIERTIAKSNDLYAITSFIKGVNNIDLKSMTSALIAAFEASDQPAKELVINNFMVECVNKINLKLIVQHAIKNGKIELLEWIVSYGFGGLNKVKSLRDILSTHNIKIQKIEEAFLNSKSATSIFSFARLFGENKRGAYNKLRKLGEIDLAMKLIDELNEDWVNALKAMK